LTSCRYTLSWAPLLNHCFYLIYSLTEALRFPPLFFHFWLCDQIVPTLQGLPWANHISHALKFLSRSSSQAPSIWCPKLTGIKKVSRAFE